jgi:hypothetical protein
MGARRESRETPLISLYRISTGRRNRLRVLGPVVLAAALTAGCGASSAAPAPSSSGSASAGTAGSSAFRQCLERHGVQPPKNRPSGGGFGGGGFGGGGGGGTPPAHAASGAFQKALKACGGSFPHGAGSGG